MPTDTTIDVIEKLWPVLLSALAVVVAVATFSVRYQAHRLQTDRRITSVEARILSLENEFRHISTSLTRIETIVTMERKEHD